MPRISRRGHVNAPGPGVFEFIARRENSPLFVPNLVRVWDIEPAEARVGQRWRWEYRILGQSFEGTASVTELVPGRRLAFRTAGALDATWTFEVGPDHGGCTVGVTIDQAASPGRGGLLGIVMNPADLAFQAVFDHQAAEALERIRSHFR